MPGFVFGAAGAYTQYVAIIMKNLRRNNPETIGPWKQLGYSMMAGPKVWYAQYLAHNKVKLANLALQANIPVTLVSDYIREVTAQTPDQNVRYF